MLLMPYPWNSLSFLVVYNLPSGENGSESQELVSVIRTDDEFSTCFTLNSMNAAYASSHSGSAASLVMQLSYAVLAADAAVYALSKRLQNREVKSLSSNQHKVLLLISAVNVMLFSLHLVT